MSHLFSRGAAARIAPIWLVSCSLLMDCGPLPKKAERPSDGEGEDLKVAILPKVNEPISGDHIPAGTEIRVRPSGLISSLTADAGQAIPVAVAAPVLVDGETRIPEGTEAVLSVVDSQTGSPRGGGLLPSLTLRLREVRFGLVNRAELHTAPVVIKASAAAQQIAGAGPSSLAGSSPSKLAVAAAEVAAGSILSFKLLSPTVIPRRSSRR